MKKIWNVLILPVVLLVGGCDDEWLDIRHDKKQVIPQTLEDYQALLDYFPVFNQWSTPIIGEVSSDDYYVTMEDWEALTSGSGLNHKSAYIWASDIFGPEDVGTSWNYPYRQIYYANVVLEGMEELDSYTGQEAYANQVLGSALFWRSWGFYQLSQLFCKPYDEATATEDLGIPLRLESDPNITSERASVADTYQQMLEDLSLAVTLLPDLPLETTRPSKASAWALLSRIYLQTGDFEAAYEASSNSLGLYNVLMDYNNLDPEEDYPIEQFNEETLIYTTLVDLSSGIMREHKLIVNPELYELYDDDDLRKSIFYYEDEGIRYKGSYSNAAFFGMYFFGGIATDEVFLTKAECAARLNKPEEALETINHILETRYVTGSFEPVELSGDQLLEFILQERRKELAFRGLRWSDLRRLNKEEKWSHTLTRTLGTETYSLEPGSDRYVLPIPPMIIQLSGIQQNER